MKDNILMSLISSKLNLYFFYFLILCGFGFIVFSQPFLRYPYDVFAHLITIDEMYHGMEKSSAGIPTGRLIWHKIWAWVFQVVNLESHQFLLRARIIHVIQTVIAFFSIYFFSLVVIRNIFPKIAGITLKYLALWSVIIWYTIFATFSVYYHMVWNLWYSLNYQITLPLFFYMTGLTLILFLEKTSVIKKIIYIAFILLITQFILQAHAMEFIYYLMYMSIFMLLHIKETFQFVRKYYYLFLLLSGMIIYIFYTVRFDESQLLEYIFKGNLFALYEDILMQGNLVLSRYNRVGSVINELMYVILFSTILMLLLLSWKKLIPPKLVNIKILLFLIATSLFVVIPLYQYSAGLFSIITKIQVVHRVYYSASLFILLPLCVYTLSLIFKWRLIVINVVLIFILISTYYYSKFTATTNHNYYKNIQSIQNSFTTKYNFHLSVKQIEAIGEKLEKYEIENKTGKRIQYYARPDVAFVIKYIFQKKKIIWRDRRSNIDYKRAYHRDVHELKYHKYKYILFDDSFLYTQNQLNAVEKRVNAYEKENKTGKRIFYFARPEIAYIIKFVLHKKAYWIDKTSEILPKRAYNEHVNVYKYTRYKYILFDEKNIPIYSSKDFYK